MSTQMHIGSVRSLVLGFALLVLLGACGSVDNASDGEVAAAEGPQIAQCQAGSDWPTFAESSGGAGSEGLLASTTGNVDFDGEVDEVSLFSRLADDGGYEGWLRVEFSNGGIATGSWEGVGFNPVSDAEVRIVDLTGSPADGETYEIVVQVGESAADGGWSVVAIEECSVVTTTLDGEPFVFGRGDSDGASTIAGCPFVGGGDDSPQFSVIERNLADGEWLRENFELSGTEWLLLNSEVFSDFPVGDGSIYFPVGPTLDTCAPTGSN